jgi:hypothetical protein
MLTTRAATVEDARYVGERLRAGDAAEVAMFGVDGFRAIEAGMNGSFIAECLLLDGEPVAVFGLYAIDLIGGIAQPWILTAQAIESCRVGYARFTRAALARALELATRLENIVDPNYTRAINLLEWLGFTVEPEQDGIRRFWMEKN